MFNYRFNLYALNMSQNASLQVQNFNLFVWEIMHSKTPLHRIRLQRPQSLDHTQLIKIINPPTETSFTLCSLLGDHPTPTSPPSLSPHCIYLYSRHCSIIQRMNPLALAINEPFLCVCECRPRLNCSCFISFEPNNFMEYAFF